MIEFLPYIAGQITQPFNLVLMFGATVIGLIFGAIPGLSEPWPSCFSCRLHIP